MDPDHDLPSARRILRDRVLPPRNRLDEAASAERHPPARVSAPGVGLRATRRSRGRAGTDPPSGSVRGPSGSREPVEDRGAGRDRREEASAEGRFARWLRASTAGRSWAVRAPLLPILAWIAWKHAGDIWWGSLLAGVNLVFHELGHVVFGLTGNELLTIAGGTVLELLVPVTAAVVLARQRDAFGVGVAGFWLGTAFASVGRYVYDTRSQIFDRVSIGPATGPDDWTYLLARWDLIRQDRVIGMAVKEIGVAVMATGIAWCAFVLWRMARAPGRGGDDFPGTRPR